jgi:hypothetical protein
LESPLSEVNVALHVLRTTAFLIYSVFSWSAGGEDEISFDPDEIITNIEKIDDGWWMGTNPRGETGLFPSNYVEEI